MFDVLFEIVKDNFVCLFKSELGKIDVFFGGCLVVLKCEFLEVEVECYLIVLCQVGVNVYKEVDLVVSLSLVEMFDYNFQVVEEILV